MNMLGDIRELQQACLE